METKLKHNLNLIDFSSIHKNNELFSKTKNIINDENNIVNLPDNRPILSVVIITYNAAKTIKASIDSIFKQKDINPSTDIELIIVDDKSTDNTKEICDAYKDKVAHYIYHILDFNNHYLGALRYQGTSLATGQWITYLDADDYFLEDHLGLFLNTINFEDNGHKVYPVGIWTHELFKSFDVNIPEGDMYSNGHLHGKFYNLDYMRKYNINFDKDRAFEEDLYFNLWYIYDTVYNNEIILEVSGQTYYYIGSDESICNVARKKTIDTGILYPDKHLLNFDDYIYAAGYKCLEYYYKSRSQSPDKQAFFEGALALIIFSIYYSYNYYILTKYQFDILSDEFIIQLNKAKLSIQLYFNKLPAEFTMQSIETAAYRDLTAFTAAKDMVNNFITPHGYVANGVCPLSLHEFLTEFMCWC